MSFYRTGQEGFIKAIVLIVILLIILGYFGYNVEEIINSPIVQKNLDYAWNFTKFVWTNYLETFFEFVWNKIIYGWRTVEKVIY